MKFRPHILAVAVIACLTPLPAPAEAGERAYSARVNTRNLYWGDTHLHSAQRNEGPPAPTARFPGYRRPCRESGRADALIALIRSVAYGQAGERAYFWAADKDIPKGFGSLGSDSPNPEDLWANLELYVERTGGDVLAIPHNSNLSNGEMFTPYDWDGKFIDHAYARKRSQWEPLVEVTQIKGDSESHPVLSPTDEFADFETWNSWAGPTYGAIRKEGWIDRKTAEYARSALKLGLAEQSRLGANPFKFGMIGSTDAHTSLSAVEEDNFRGKFAVSATYVNSIGDPVLAVAWQDPDFDPRESAFYYLRVLEIPTPRWTAYDAASYGLADVPVDVPMVLQERAYTSPIWHGAIEGTP